MKRALVVLGVLLFLVAMAVYVASWFWAGDEVEASAARPWPDGLGTLADVPGRYPPQRESEGAGRLMKLAEAVAPDDAVTSYMRREIARGDLAIAEPPPLPDVASIRDLLLREPVVWGRDLEQQHGGLLPKTEMFLTLTRSLVATALGRARQKDVAAWDDLRAAWNLTKSLEDHPHLILTTIAMSMTRAINAVAWKMPLPVPAWFEEVQRRDSVRLLFETLQFEKWRRWDVQTFPLKPFAATIDRERAFVAELGRVTRCEFHPVSQTTNLDITWQRAFRYRAEREAAANALRARAGQPIEESSQCSDGGWSFDGKTLRFAKPIALPERRDTSMPLTLQIRE
jgi:hypothetical protein